MEIKARVSAIARNGEKIVLTRHAREKCIKRGITLQQIQRVLVKNFHTTEEPTRNAAGEWCLTAQGVDTGMNLLIRLSLVEKTFKPVGQPEEIIKVITVYEVWS